MSSPSPAWVHFGFGLLSACVLSVIVFTVRIRVFGRLEALRAQEERQKRELERVADEARQSEQKYRNLLETARDVIFTVSLDGTITSLNPAFETVTGWSRAEWLGKPFTLLLCAQDVPLAAHLFRRAVQGEALSVFELRVISKSGEPLFGEFTATQQTEDGNVVGVWGIARDVTDRRKAEEARVRAEVAEAARRELEREVAERKRVEEALRQSEEHFRLLIENQRDIIILLNSDGTVRYQSPSAERELGYTPEEVIGRSGFDLIHPEDLPRVLQAFADIVQKPGLTPPLELRVRHKNGSWRVLEALGNNLLHDPVVAGIIVNTRDITDRKRAEEALRESEERYRDLFENASDAIAIVGTDGGIIDVNRATETMLGYARAQMVGRRYHDYLTPAARGAWDEYVRRVLAGEEPPDSLELEFVRQDGSRVAVESRTRIIRDLEGTPVALQGIARDISSRKALERQRADFFAMLTHDIRNPLGVILGYTDLLLEEAREEDDSSERKELLLRLRNSILTVHSLLANYLDLSKIEAGQLALVRVPVELNPLLRRVRQQYEPEALHKSLTFTVDLQDDLPLVEGDPIALERVFANLVLNAFKFTPEGGQVTVRSRAHSGEVVVTVADNGPGIAPDELPVLFEKYRRAERARAQAGTGLGLFIVKTLVEAQGGRVEVQSVPGRGTRFSVCLPVASFSSSAAL